MSAEQLMSWIQYDAIEPISEHYVAGITASAVYNVNRKDGKWLDPFDFVPKLPIDRNEGMTAEEWDEYKQELKTVLSKRGKG